MSRAVSHVWDSMRSVWGSPTTPGPEDVSEVRLRPQGMSASTPNDEGLEDTVPYVRGERFELLAQEVRDESDGDDRPEVAWDPSHDLSIPIRVPPNTPRGPEVEDLGRDLIRDLTRGRLEHTPQDQLRDRSALEREASIHEDEQDTWRRFT